MNNAGLDNMGANSHNGLNHDLFCSVVKDLTSNITIIASSKYCFKVNP